MLRRIAQLVLVGALATLAAAGQQTAPAKPTPGQPGGQPQQSPATDQSAPLTPQQPATLQPLAPLYQPPPETPVEPPQETTDVKPLTGVLSVGTDVIPLGTELVTSFHAAQSINSAPDLHDPNSYSWRGTSILGANLAFHSRWHSGGVFLYNGVASWNGHQKDDATHLQQAGFSQPFRLGRLQLLLADDFSYLPQGGGFNGMQGLGGLASANGFGGYGLVPTLLNSALVPDQTVITQDSGRIANASSLQAAYSLTGRSSVTTSFSYGLLHSLEGDLLNGAQYNVSAGLSRRLSARDSVGLSYGYAAFTYEGLSRDNRNHQFGLNYGRKLTGRMDFSAQVSAQFNDTTDGPVEQKNVFWGSEVALSYTRTKWNARVEYVRSVSGGSGVIPGARTDHVDAAFSRTIARTWQTLASFSYAHNEALLGTTVFDTISGGATVSRHLLGNVSLYVSYSAQEQDVSGPCLAIACAGGRLDHVGSIGLSFEVRPLRSRGSRLQPATGRQP